MKIEDDNRGQKPANPVAAIIDIARRNQENKPLYGKTMVVMADKLRALAIAAHPNGRVFQPNYRKEKVVVKVEGYRARDKMSAEYDALDNFVTKNGIVAANTASGGRTYSILSK